ncbi:hypothetical protein RB594_006295 [Gaeumannomyces avenae]
MASTAPTIPPGSTVLVTGVNGLLGTHIASALVAAGYRVRGTVRSLSRSAWVPPLFASRHPDAPSSSSSSGALELFEVPDMHAPGAWAGVFSDGAVAAVASVASGTSMSLDVPDVAAAVALEAAAYIGLLDAARAAGSVRSVVFTSSAWAAYTPDATKAGVLTADSWNDAAVSLAAAAEEEEEKEQSGSSRPRGLCGVMAMKVGYERKVWEWVRSARPGYSFNVVLPDTVFGPVMDPARQGASTVGLVRWLWEGRGLDAHVHMAPQWFVDARDVGRLYVACLTLPGLDRRRVYGFAKRYSWPRVLDIMKALYPQRTEWPALPEAGWDAFDVPTNDAEDLIKQVGDGSGWISLEDSIRDTVESFLVKDAHGRSTLEAIKPIREAFE